MKSMAISRGSVIAMLLCSMMSSACAYAPKDKRATGTFDPVPVDTYRISQASESPELTAEEAGRRVLSLVDRLESMDELSLEQVIARTGMPLKYAPAGKVHAFAVELAQDAGFYNVIYRDKGGRRFVEIRYEAPDNPRTADAFPCALGATAVAERLKTLGYGMTTDIDEMGRTLEHVFSRNEVRIRAVPSRHSMPGPLGIDSCVEVLTIQSKD
ncbi:hypothetical protein [Lysobacter firmicutimachus]|uniref:Secreted protein n=1 Tax=Lysobacter firmicutimachus TaxID=1792846 RepID=A0ABU8D7B3_9GAMM